MDDFKVLVVDDEEDFATSLSKRLRIRDLPSDVALDGEQALASLKQEEPSVMLLDLRMPDMDGLEVLRQVRKAYPTVQVVILTGHGSDRDEEEAKKLGAFAYLQKPVEMDSLIKTLRKAHARFRQAKHGADAAFMGAALAAAGEVEIARQVMREEKERKE